MTRQIMMVDDDPGVLQLFGMILERAGYGVLKARHAHTALEMLAEDTPDLFILDYMMPDMDGLELCQELRARPETAHTPVLFFSAWGSEEHITQALEAGADDYLVKPAKPSDLLEKMHALLEQAIAEASQ